MVVLHGVLRMTPQERWLEYLRTDRGRSTNTISTYARTLRTLPADPLSMTREHVESWWASRARDQDGNERPHSSRNNELSAVRSFFRWSQRYELRADDPTSRIDQLRQQKRQSKFIGQSDLDFMLGKLEPDLRRAVALGAYGGLRVSEAAYLNWDHVNTEIRRMTVRGKGDKERTVGISFQLMNILLPEVQHGTVITGRPEAYSGPYLSIKVNEVMRKYNIQGTFHALRHRFGYMSASAGIAPTSIARAMGHSNLATTMLYCAAVDSDLDLIAEAVAR
jgi:integrase/recombinase XerC